MEILISSNKYERWVEPDPELSRSLAEGWDLLLTGRYTLRQICEELTKRGYTRATGRPWAWDDPKTGNRQWAHNRLYEIFTNPFYAGWAVSKRFRVHKLLSSLATCPARHCEGVLPEAIP